MVVCKGQIHHGADFNLAIDSNRSLLDGVKSKHCALWQIDDRCAHQGSKDASIADGEGTASHVLDRELPVPGL